MLVFPTQNMLVFPTRGPNMSVFASQWNIGSCPTHSSVCVNCQPTRVCDRSMCVLYKPVVPLYRLSQHEAPPPFTTHGSGLFDLYPPANDNPNNPYYRHT